MGMLLEVPKRFWTLRRRFYTLCAVRLRRNRNNTLSMTTVHPVHHMHLISVHITGMCLMGVYLTNFPCMSLGKSIRTCPYASLLLCCPVFGSKWGDAMEQEWYVPLLAQSRIYRPDSFKGLQPRPLTPATSIMTLAITPPRRGQ